MGWFLVELDRLLYVFWLRPEESLSEAVKSLWKGRRWWAAVKLIKSRRDEQQILVFRSSLAAVAFLPVALFGLTSSGGGLPEGLVIGFGWHLLVEFWQERKRNPQLLHYRLFWLIKREVSGEEREWFLKLFSLAVGGLSLLLI